MDNKEAIAVLDDMKVKIAVPKSAVTQNKRNEALDLAINSLEADMWFLADERLPEQDGNYLVVTSDNDIDIGVYHPRYIVPQWSMCDANGFFWVEDKNIEIVKWRPLPKI